MFSATSTSSNIVVVDIWRQKEEYSFFSLLSVFENLKKEPFIFFRLKWHILEPGFLVGRLLEISRIIS
jgi:hypothetical protein